MCGFTRLISGCECPNDEILEFSNTFQKKLDNNTPSRLVRAWPGCDSISDHHWQHAIRQIDGVAQHGRCLSVPRLELQPREHIAFSSPLCVALVVAWPYRQHVRPLYRFVFVCGKNTHPAVHSVCADQIFARMDVEDI